MHVAKVFDEEPLHRDPVEAYLLVALPLGDDGAGKLESVEGAPAGQRRLAVARAWTIGPGRVSLANGPREHGVVAKTVVLVEVLVAEDHPEHTLCEEVADRVLDPCRVSMIREALCEALEQR